MIIYADMSKVIEYHFLSQAQSLPIGIRTRQGIIIAWPGPIPDDGTVQAWITAWENRGPSREEELDTELNSDSQIQNWKTATNAQIDTWWTNNVTDFASLSTVVKKLAKLIIRRVL